MMTAPTNRVALVVPTLGRPDAALRLLRSLERCPRSIADVLVVDQNDRPIAANLLSKRWSFPVRTLHTPGERGASRARNRGWCRTSARVVLFPDDDCWYPPGAIEAGLAAMDRMGTQVLAGRAEAPDGRPINGRFEATPCFVGRQRVWTTQIEWMVLFERSVLEAVGGYDERVGVGAATPWQSCEAQDIVLRAMSRGYRVGYDPSFRGHHPELDTLTPDVAMRRKGRAYARGHGWVLRKHGFGPAEAAYWAGRPMVGAALDLARGRTSSAAYRAGVALGRLEGYVGQTIGAA